MGTHFTLLSEKEGKKGDKENSTKAANTAVGSDGPLEKKQKPMSTKKAMKKAAENMGLNDKEKAIFADPGVVQAMADPKVQHCIALLKAGKEMDMRAIGRQDFPTFQKLQYLISRGVLGVQA